MNFNIDWIKGAAKTALAFGKKNLPSLMVGGSVGLQWLSLILMMVEAPKAVEKIEATQEQRAAEDQEPMTKVEKAMAYGTTCWPSLVTMAGSSALEICAHKNLLNHVGEMYMLAQLYKEDGEKLRKQILNEKGGEKKLDQYCDQIFEEEHPVEEIAEIHQRMDIPVGETLIKDETTGIQKSMPIDRLRCGFDQFNEMMHDRWAESYEKAVKKKFALKSEDDAFFSDGDKPWGTKRDDDLLRTTIYVRASLDEFLTCIGFKDPHSPPSDIGQAFEFHYYGTGPCVDYNKVVRFKDFIDPATGKIVYAVIGSLRQRDMLFISDEAYY